MADTSRYRLPAALCAVVNGALFGSHATLERLFTRAGAPGDPPDVAHHSKWKEWLLRANQDPNVDPLQVLGVVIEEVMEGQPSDEDVLPEWLERKARLPWLSSLRRA